jgi:presenilin-like A22 family membrane protease
METKHKDIKYFIKTLSIVVGLVMIWRGVWYVLDAVDVLLFGEYNYVTGLVGITLGVLLLYLPDRDLKEIEKL